MIVNDCSFALKGFNLICLRFASRAKYKLQVLRNFPVIIKIRSIPLNGDTLRIVHVEWKVKINFIIIILLNIDQNIC